MILPFFGWKIDVWISSTPRVDGWGKWISGMTSRGASTCVAFIWICDKVVRNCLNCKMCFQMFQICCGPLVLHSGIQICHDLSGTPRSQVWSSFNQTYVPQIGASPLFETNQYHIPPYLPTMGLIGFLPPFLVSPHCSSQKKWNPHVRIPWSMFILVICMPMFGCV